MGHETGPGYAGHPAAFGNTIRSARARVGGAIACMTLVVTGLIVATSAMAGAQPEASEFQFLQLINADRAAAGASPLRLSVEISAVAERWTEKMVARGVLEHNPYFVNEIEPYTPDWRGMAENVGRTTLSVASLHAAFMNSPGHRTNILNPAYNWVGIGAVTHNGVVWVTVNFVDTDVELTEAVAPPPTTTTTAPPPTTTTTTRPPTPHQARFGDVPVGSYYDAAVAWARRTGITTGCTPTRFCPNEQMTRGQMITLVWRAAGSPSPRRAATFVDVPAAAYYSKAVAWAHEQGITTGCQPTRFCPNEPTTRAQGITFLWRFNGSP